MKREPATIIGAITAVVSAVLALLVAFGMDVSEDQQAAILGVVAAVAPLVAGVLIRSKVWSPASVDKVIEDVRDEQQKPEPPL